MRQWPSGLFVGEIAKSCRVFTGGKSAIDLLAIDGDTLILFELKNGRNTKLGALSEAFFYGCVMRDLLRELFSFGNAPILERLLISPEDIRKCKSVRAVVLAPHLHPLIWNECDPTPRKGSKVLSLLNEAAGRTWGNEIPVEFEAWTFETPFKRRGAELMEASITIHRSTGEIGGKSRWRRRPESG